ncbi:MAG: hypothetical protein U9Q90_07020 [Campylobacterota bacterium]|nr:hypothetical protein [Campylobacterota bacterium]
MKNGILIMAITLLLGFSFTYAGTSTVENKQSQTKIYPKIEMIFVSQPGCNSCEKIKEYMQYGAFKKLITEHFIVVKKDLSEARTLPNNLEQPIGTPTIYFLNEQGEEIIDTMIGGKSEENFMDILQEAIAASK